MKFLNKIATSLCVLFLAINLNSCQTNKDSKMEWKIIDFNKIPGEKPYNTYFNALNRYKFNKIVNYNKDIFFLLGDNSEESPESSDAIIYATKNFGDTWEKKTLGKGSVMEGVLTGNIFFVLIDSKGIGGNSFNTLLRSKDLGNTWEKMNDFENENIQYINFSSENNGIAKFYISNSDKNNNKDYITENRYTIDGGKTWKKFETEVFNDPDFTPNLYYLTPSLNVLFTKKDNVMAYDIINSSLITYKKLPLPKGMEVSGSNVYTDFKNKEPYVAFFNKSNQKGELYYINEDKHISVDLNNGASNVYGGNFFYEFESSSPFSHYSWSEDAGKTWNTEKMEEFFPDPTPIGYAENGYIYMIAALFKGNQNEKGARLIIGHPKK